VGNVSRGLGSRQRAILAKLAERRDLNRYTNRPPQWVTLRELAGLRDHDPYRHRASDVEATRRALRGLVAAGLVEVRLVRLDGAGQQKLGARLAPGPLPDGADDPPHSRPAGR
jgi:hypothetical protein